MSEMNRFERIAQVSNELDGFIERVRREYSFTYVELVGVMIFSIIDLWDDRKKLMERSEG